MGVGTVRVLGRYVIALFYLLTDYFTPADMGRVKVIGLSVCYISSLLSSSPRKVPDLNMEGPKQLISVTSRNQQKNWLECASNRLVRSTNITNSVIVLAIIATPIDCAHYFLLMCTAGLVEIINIACLSLCRRLQMLHARC